MLNFDNYYINQTASYVKNLTFKNNTTVGTYGCGVCCFAMIVCWDQGITSESGKASVVKQIIANATNSNGDLTYNFGTINNVSYTHSKVSDIAAQIQKDVPTVVQLNGHYVLAIGYDSSKSGYAAYIIKDPGSSSNTNLQQPMNKYGTTIKSKRILTRK